MGKQEKLDSWRSADCTGHSPSHPPCGGTAGRMLWSGIAHTDLGPFLRSQAPDWKNLSFIRNCSFLVFATACAGVMQALLPAARALVNRSMNHKAQLGKSACFVVPPLGGQARLGICETPAPPKIEARITRHSEAALTTHRHPMYRIRSRIAEHHNFNHLPYLQHFLHHLGAIGSSLRHPHSSFAVVGKSPPCSPFK